MGLISPRWQNLSINPVRYENTEVRDPSRQLEELIGRKVASGLYQSVSEGVREAVRRMDEPDGRDAPGRTVPGAPRG
jgi:hypothetical protein